MVLNSGFSWQNNREQAAQRSMLRLFLAVTVCGCVGTCALWRRRGGGEMGKRLRRMFGGAALFSAMMACLLFLHSHLSPGPPPVLQEFVHSTVNCSGAVGLRAGLHGEVGGATRHQWFHAVGYTVDDLRLHWAFPQQPDSRDEVTSLQRSFDQRAWKAIGGKYAHRVFGYLLPPASGMYTFQVSLSEMSARGTAEFWLSPTSDPSQSMLLAATSVTTKNRYYANSVSSQALLQSCAIYYFEFLEQAYNGKSVAEVMWKIPDSWSFSSVPSSALARAVGPEGGQSAEFTSHTLPSMALQRHKKSYFVGDSVLPVHELPVLPECEYESRMAYPHKLKEYWGHKELVWAHIYPRLNSGTKFVPPAFAAKILKLYTTAFNQSKHKGLVKRIRYMDTTENMRNLYLDRSDNHRSAGTRMLLEMDVQLEGKGEVTHTSEYVYLPAGKDTLCHTANFQWRRNVDVHIVVSVKNLGVWVKHLIHNFEHVYEVTKDEHFQLIIVDYQSADLDVEAELKASSLPRWKVVKMSGGFSRSGGLQAGINYVTDPDSIIMTVDMHLTLPPGFVEYTRRHVVQGKMGFSPMFFRLNEGCTEMTWAGFWETLTYGLLGMYKSDWDTSGGFNIDKYTTKWGGEDWDAVDRIREQGIELFRLGYPGLVHYFHSKAGLWSHR